LRMRSVERISERNMKSEKAKKGKGAFVVKKKEGPCTEKNRPKNAKGRAQ